MIRMEYPKTDISNLSDHDKIIALKNQVDMLANNLQIVMDSIEDDLERLERNENE